jgi:hypothetical protein
LIKGLELQLLLAGGADGDAALVQIDFSYFVADTGIDAIFVSEFLRCYGDKFPDVVDNLADIVGDASSGVGRMRPPLEDDDLQFRLDPLCLGGGAHSRRIAADYHQPLFLHSSNTSSSIHINGE